MNDKTRPHVEPLTQGLGAPIVMPLDVSRPGELEALFAAVAEQWGRLGTPSQP